MSNSTHRQFFDLHITGVGYVNRIRKVTPKRGDAFRACDISALNGPADDVEDRDLGLTPGWSGAMLSM